MSHLLTIEVEKDDGGYHAVIIEIGDDSVLYVTDSYRTASAAVREATRWMEVNQ